MNKRINVTQTFLPPQEEYQEYLNKIWLSGQLTNQGPILKEFQKNAEEHLNVQNFHFVTNGTIALQIALRALNITGGEIITTPFSYVATTSAILWERCKPVYVDIDEETLNIDPTKIESAITKNTKAILAVHVFGNPCDVHEIQRIADKHKLKVIYDAAHAFGVTYKGESIFNYGDVSTCSFHSTKLFHTIEGGGVFVKDNNVSDKVELIKRFGHHGDEHKMLGINAKASEFQAAMGLCNLNYIDNIIRERKRRSEIYDSQLNPNFRSQKMSTDSEYNYIYYPLIFESEDELVKSEQTLNNIDVHPRRYFYPSLNTLSYLEVAQSCPVSEDISKRVLCLPLYDTLEEEMISKICRVINR